MAFLMVYGCSSNVATTKYIPRNKNHEDQNNHEYYLIYMPDMKYPDFLWDRGIEGYVIVELDIDENGVTRNHKIIEAEKGDILGDIAIKHIRKYKYSPSKIDGAAVTTKGVSLKVSFCFPERRNEKDFVYEHKSKNCDKLHP